MAMTDWGGSNPPTIACLCARVLAPPLTDQGGDDPLATARVHACVRTPTLMTTTTATAGAMEGGMCANISLLY
jgi:hypothetical protein